MGICMGTAFRKTMNLDQAEATAKNILGAGHNKLQTGNLQTLGPWQSAPVSNLLQGIQPNSSVLHQLGVGGKMTKFK